MPVTVAGLSGAIAMAAGGDAFFDSHTCAVLADGEVRCWGTAGYGNLGDGTTTSSSMPVAVTGLSGAVAIAAGWGYTCVLLGDRSARCWGFNALGALGDGTRTSSATPVTVADLFGAVAIAASGDHLGSAHTCALLDDGTARCWGDNEFGKLGNGTMTYSITPVTVRLLP
jgi:alpha-tubulin suppressor-like RCC1 family protein